MTPHVSHPGTMALSETHAGSSLAELRTTATKVEGGDRDDEYRLKGSKMWTSGFEHDLSENIVHFVLAKIDSPTTPKGSKGISLFLVPKVKLDGARNDLQLDGLNHKLGQRGITNCYWSMGDDDACVGYLVGEREHAGLAQMFFMMNEMRVAVGLHGACCGVRGFAESLAYAKERVQGAKLGSGTFDQVPIIEHADVRRQLLVQKALAEGALHLVLFGASLVDDAKDDPAGASALILDKLTPIIKSWPAEHALEANKWGLQVLGGYGYTRDYPLERIYRDNRLNMIHEGTHGIQALDLLARKATMHNGAATKALADAMAATAADVRRNADLADVHHLATALLEAVDRYGATTRLLAKTMAHDAPKALANAHEYLNMVGHVVVAWCWLREAAAAKTALNKSSDDHAAFYDGKLRTADFFYKHELPKTATQAALLQSLDTAALDMPKRAF